MKYSLSSFTWHRAEMAPGRPFLAKTSATTLVMATEVRGVVGAPGHTVTSKIRERK